MIDPAIEEFVERARAVSVSEAAGRLGIKLGRNEYTGPCPRCGGDDRFSINGQKNVFNCRGCSGGRDAIGLMAHFHNLDLRDRAQFLEACAETLGEEIPEGGERESDEQRAERHARIAALKAENEQKNQKKTDDQNRFRELEVSRAHGIYSSALNLSKERASVRSSSQLAAYLQRRTGFEMHPGVFDHVRLSPDHSYWHGKDEMGRMASPWQGPAMIAAFVSPAGAVTGCHETWIDLANAPKFRPDLGLDAKGEALPTKKMRGTKKGSLIPLFGSFNICARWVLGEGIETVLAYAGAENWRPDTFYAATGDLGNLAGPADPKSAFPHPTIKGGNNQAKKVQGPVPKADQAETEAVQVPDYVEDLIILVDGDSEIIFTAAAIARACARLEAPDRIITPFWPPEGEDFASLFAKLNQGENTHP